MAGLLDLLNTYRRLRPDLVHHHTLKPILYGTLAARWAGVPAVVNSVTGLGFVFLSPRVSARLLRRAVSAGLRRALDPPNVRVIFENRGDREYFLREGMTVEERSSLIEGVGVDLSLFRPAPEPKGEKVVALASRMLWDKGVGDFVEAAVHLRQAGVTARFALVGAPDPGNPSSIAVEEIKRWADTGPIEWWGHSDDMPGTLAQCHVVVLPSHGEGLPTVLLEAAASGRPVIATDIPGCREVVIPGETGLLVPPGNSSELANAIATLLADPDRRIGMGKRGREFMERRFSQDDINRRTIEVYENMLAHPRV